MIRSLVPGVCRLENRSGPPISPLIAGTVLVKGLRKRLAESWRSRTPIGLDNPVFSILLPSLYRYP